jgi:hypothetical protein
MPKKVAQGGMDVGPWTALRLLPTGETPDHCFVNRRQRKTSPEEPMQEQFRGVDVYLDGQARVASTVQIAKKSLKDLSVGTAPKPADNAWTEIDIEHDWFSYGEKETGEPSGLCGVGPPCKRVTIRYVCPDLNICPPAAPHSAELRIIFFLQSSA